MSDETWVRLSVFAGVLAVMALWEWLAPRRLLVQGRKRWPANLGIVVLDSAVAWVVLRLVLPAGAVGAALWAETHHVGLLSMLSLADIAVVVLGVILLDLVIYGQHVLFHAVPLLWRLHMVHHADRDIDVTTGLRFHPIEILISIGIKIGAVILLGVPVIAVVLFEVILNGMAMFNHANARLPLRLDALLRLLFVTPDMHRVHHSVLRHETNSNYGFNLSVWDRLFGTYRTQPEQGHDDMTIGLEQFQQQPTHRLFWMLRLPFYAPVGQYPMMGEDKSDESK